MWDVKIDRFSITVLTTESIRNSDIFLPILTHIVTVIVIQKLNDQPQSATSSKNKDSFTPIYLQRQQSVYNLVFLMVTTAHREKETLPVPKGTAETWESIA